MLVIDPVEVQVFRKQEFSSTDTKSSWLKLSCFCFAYHSTSPVMLPSMSLGT